MIESDKQFIENISPNLLDTEIAKAEVFIDLHKCPWYKNFFGLPKYKLVQGSTGIGNYSTIVCEHCKQSYDITDYGAW